MIDKKKLARELVVLLIGFLVLAVISEYQFSAKTANFLLHICFAVFIMRSFRKSLEEAGEQDKKREEEEK
jgi:Ca2+/Na+ antiporter